MKKQKWNRDWYFCKAESEGEMQKIHLPHDAMLTEERVPELEKGNATGFYPGGKYIYRKDIYGEETYRDKTVWIEFEGVYMNSEVLLNGNLITKNGKKLSIAMLHEDYGANFLLQECLEQSEFMSQFNPSSVNTIRMTTYRDESGNVIVTSSIMRIGAKGSDVDNAHSGGKFCGISSNGKVGNYVCDWLGTKQTKYNGLDFENNNWIIPNFERIKQFAQNISKHIIHHDIVALDIALDKDNTPKLIEFNVGGFGAWAFLMGGHSVFSNMDEQIFKRCYKAYQQLEFYIWTPINRNNCIRAL